MKRGWWIFLISACLFGYEFFLRISPSVMTNNLIATFSINSVTLGILGSVFFYAYTLMQIPVGILVDHYGPRRLLILTCLLCALGIFIFGISPSFWVAVCGRLLIGFAAAFAFVSIIRVATLWLPEHQLATATGILFTLGFVGAIVGDNVLSRFELHFGWRQLSLLLAMIGLSMGVILFFFLKEASSFKHKPKDISLSSNFKIILRELLIIIKDPQIWLNGIIGLLMYFPTNAFAELWGVPYFMQVDHLSKPEAGQTVSMIFLGWAVGALSFGWISDRLRLRRTPLAFGAASAALCFILLLMFPNSNLIFIDSLLFLFGVFSSSEALNFPIARELAQPQLAGTALGVTNFIVAAAGILAQPMTGLLLYLNSQENNIAGHSIYTAASYEHAVIILPAVLILAAVLCLFLKETGKNYQQVSTTLSSPIT